MRRWGTGVAALLLVGGLACGEPSSGGNGGGGDLSALQAAAEAVDSATSSRMDMAMRMGFGGVEISVDMDGVFDFERQVGDATMSFEAPMEVPGTEGPSRMILDEQYAYVKGPAVVLYGGTGDGWVRMDLGGMPGMASSPNQDPRQYVEFLRAASDGVEEVGQEDVRGTPTTHYRAELSLEDVIEATDDENTQRYAEALQEMGSEIEAMPVDAWIADDGLPRRIEVSVTMSEVPGVPGGEMTMEISLDLFDFGVPVDVRPPKKFEEVTVPTS